MDCADILPKKIFRKASVLDSLGVNFNFLVSIVLSLLLLFSLLIFDYANVYTTTYNYFYWLNVIPAAVCFVWSLKYVTTSSVKETMLKATMEYIIIKTIFKLVEDTRFFFISSSLGGLFLSIEGGKGFRKFNTILIGLYLAQTFMLCLNFEQMAIIACVKLAYFFINYRNNLNNTSFYTNLFLLSCFYFIDLGMNFRLFKELYFLDIGYLRLVFYSYTIGIGIYLIFYDKIQYFANAYAYANFGSILSLFLYNHYKGTIYNYMDQYTLYMSLTISVGLIALSHICSKSKMVKNFPPRYQSIFEFAYFSLSNVFYAATYDEKIIKVEKKRIDPRTESTELVNLRIHDFKSIAGLHILNEMVRKTKGSVSIDSEAFATAMSQFSSNFYRAMDMAKTHNDDLDRAITEAIYEIVDANNDLISKLLYYIGFKNAGFNFLFNRNSYLNERNEILAYKIENDIKMGVVENLVGISIIDLNMDDE